MIYLTFHMTGLYMQLIHPLISGQAVGLYAPQYPNPPPVPTADSAIEVCRITQCDAIAAVPTFVEVRSTSIIVPFDTHVYLALGTIG